MIKQARESSICHDVAFPISVPFPPSVLFGAERCSNHGFWGQVQNPVLQTVHAIIPFPAHSPETRGTRVWAWAEGPAPAPPE